MNLHTPMDWFGVSFAILMMVLLPIALYRHWRGKSMKYEYAASEYFFKSEDLRRGHVRAAVPLLAGGLVLSAFALALVSIPPVPEGQIDYAFDNAFLAFLILELIFVVLWCAIILFNRPRFLVAPHYRDEPGLLQARRLRKKSSPSGR